MKGRFCKRFPLYSCSCQKPKSQPCHLSFALSPHPSHQVLSILPPRCVSNTSTFHPHSCWPSVTRSAQGASCLVSNSALTPSSPFSRAARLVGSCASAAQNPSGLPSVAPKPLPAAPALSQATSQPFSRRAFFQFLRKDTKPFPTSEPLSLLMSLPRMFFTQYSPGRLLFLFQVSVQIVLGSDSSESSFLTLFLNYVLCRTFSCWLKFPSKWMFQFELGICNWGQKPWVLFTAVYPEFNTVPGFWKRLNMYLLNKWLYEWMTWQLIKWKVSCFIKKAQSFCLGSWKDDDSSHKCRGQEEGQMLFCAPGNGLVWGLL